MIQAAIIIALAILAGHSFTWDGMIFEGVKKLISPDKKISKPIYGCPICMAPWWGSIIFFLFFCDFSFESWNIFKTWFCTIGTATGLSVISVMIIDAKDYFVARTPEKDDCCLTNIKEETVEEILTDIKNISEAKKDTEQNSNSAIENYFTNGMTLQEVKNKLNSYFPNLKYKF